MPRPTTTDRSRHATKWVAGGAIGLVAAAIIALLVVPRGNDDALTAESMLP